jgi:hypothetical protein
MAPILIFFASQFRSDSGQNKKRSFYSKQKPSQEYQKKMLKSVE